MRMNLKVILTVSLLLVVTTAVTSVTHRAQLFHCLKTCSREIARCLNLRTDKCRRSYHTCLDKARDFYRCVNSSQIKQLKAVAHCIETRCEAVPAIDQEAVFAKNPLRTQHRSLPDCLPWQKKPEYFGKMLDLSNDHLQCKRFLCNIKAKPTNQNQQKREKSGSCKAGKGPRQMTPELLAACTAPTYGQRKRNSQLILRGICEQVYKMEW